MILAGLLLANLLLISAEVTSVDEFCEKDKPCSYSESNFEERKLIFYDVNPSEGFNLRRDVYMRFAIMLAEARNSGAKLKWNLVLPPWHNMYHWKSESHEHDKPKPWSVFFDLNSLKSYTPVLELSEVFSETSHKYLEIDILYVLQNYDNAFVDGVFEEKWEIVGPCKYDGFYWGYTNVTAKEVICVKFQGKISQLWELMVTHLSYNKVMFAHGEIPLHDNYGTKSYWDCRKSMKFNSKLVKIAEKYISEQLKCNTRKCPNYVSIHWRRQDFARYRSNDVPSITGTAKQIEKAVRKNLLMTKKVFIASDAPVSELQELERELKKFGLTAYFYAQNDDDVDEYSDGEIAVIDQIICSRSAYFIGTHESTFSFRIQEEREILGFDSKTTFNRLCPDKGKCEKPSKWNIVN